MADDKDNSREHHSGLGSSVVPDSVNDAEDDQLVYDEIVQTSEIAIESAESGDGVVIPIEDSGDDLVAVGDDGDTQPRARPAVESAPELDEADILEDVVELDADEPLRRVLVVEDDDDLRRLIARLLVGKGIEVDEARRGLEAFNIVRSRPPDLIILDAMLPEVHGFDIAQKLKSSDRYGQIPIVMISSLYRGWRIARDLRESYGIEAFLEKPFKLTELWRTVEQLVYSREREVSNVAVSVSAEQLSREGMQRFQAGDLEAAIECFEEGLRLDPKASKLHFQLGVLFLKKKGMVYQAMQAFEEAVALAPEHFMALRSLAILYQRKGFRNKAIDMWERALQCSPDDETRAQIREHLIRLITS